MFEFQFSRISEMPRLSFEIIKFFRFEYEKHLKGYNVVIKDISEKERIYVIEDSHIVCVRFLLSPLSNALNKKTVEEKENSFLNSWNEGDECYDMEIVELTHNEIGFKYNNSEFIRKMELITGIKYLGACIFYNKFKGIDRPYWAKDKETYFEQLNKLYPELRLKERYDLWDGNHYYFIVFQLTNTDGVKHYVVSYTMSSPSSYVNMMGKNYIKTGRFCNENTRRNYSFEFENILKSWKGVKRQKRLEDNLKYCVVEKNTKEFDETWRYADKVLKKAYDGKFDSVEMNSYIRPNNRWVTEEYVYKTIKHLYKDYNVIYQHRPLFLKSSKGGQMSYDIFICGLNVAIEYQGKQHFEPVDFFGGKEGFENVKERDKEKAALSKANGIRLVYINYDEQITPELIKSKIG